MARIQHVGIIPDGNRRWAIKNNMNYIDAYTISMKKLASLIGSTFEYGVQIVSVYLLSKNNLKRKRDDLNSVIDAEMLFLETLLPPLCKEKDCEVHCVGSFDLLPTPFITSIEKVNNVYSKPKKRKIYLLIGYDPFDELKSCTTKNEISLRNMWVPHSVDCVVRTAGGSILLSNFLPLQSGYAQFFLVDKYFQDSSYDDFYIAYENAKRTKMPYGK